MKKSFSFGIGICFIVSFLSLGFVGCKAEAKKEALEIAVFVPGIMADSPVYSMLAAGVQEAVDSVNSRLQDGGSALDLGEYSPLVEGSKEVLVTILEAGTNQAEWSNKLTALAATGKYALIITSNPSMPEIIEPLTTQFPQVKFVVLDGFLEGNNNIATIRYNQREQAYLTGYIAALVSTANPQEMKYANPEAHLGFIAAQEYPVMNEILLPSFIEGAQAAVPEAKVDFRIVGNWYDATKGAELARSLYNSGVDVILPICGGASQGVIAAAKELGFYITWFDEDGFDKAPGYIVSSSVMAQKKMAKEATEKALLGTIEYGKAKTVGIEDGYIDFVQDNPLYIETVPESIRIKMAALVDDIKTGNLLLPSP